VDFSSFLFSEQKNLYGSDLVQGSCLFSCKYRLLLLFIVFCWK